MKEFTMSRTTFPAAKCTLVILAAILAGCPPLVDPNPELDASPSAITLSASRTVETFTITHPGGSETPLDWTIDPSDVEPWYTVSTLVGMLPDLDDDTPFTQVVTINIVPEEFAALAPGVYVDELTITAPNNTLVLAVSLNVTAAGELLVDPADVDFGTTGTEETITLRNGGDELINWTLEPIPAESNWLSTAEGSATTGELPSNGSAVLDLVVNRDGLAEAIYTTEITISSDAGDVVVNVTMIVPGNVGELSVSPSSLTFNSEGETEGSVSIRNVGTGTITWTLTPDLPAWLSLSDNSDTVADEIDYVTVNVDATILDPGDFSHTITITAQDGSGENVGSGTIDVSLTVPEPIPLLEVTPAEIELRAAENETFIRVRNTGTGELIWNLVSNDPWITFAPGDPTSGIQTTNNQIIDIEIDRATLNPGPQTGSVSVTSNGGDQNVSITVAVLPPTLSVNPDLLDFGTRDLVENILIFNAGVGTVNWSIDTTTFPVWLRDADGVPLITDTSDPVTGDETDLVKISVNRVGLMPGDYAFDTPGIVVNSDAGQVAIPTYLSVAERPVLAVTDADGALILDLDGVPFVDAGLQDTVSFFLSNSGTGAVTFEIDSAGFPDWLTVDPLGPLGLEPSDGLFEIRATLDRAGLAFGAYEHSLTLETNDPDRRTQIVRIEMAVPKIRIIRSQPSTIDFGIDRTTDVFAVANFGDPGTQLEFRVESNKPWLFNFPSGGSSIGVEDPAFNADFRPINVSIDRTGLNESGAGTGEFTIFAVRSETDPATGEIVEVRDDSIAAPIEVLVSVEASELFFETPPARLRVPSQVRYIPLMRNLRFGPITLEDNQLPVFQENFLIKEADLQIENKETSQFLTSAENLRQDVVLLLDYSNSAYLSAVTAQQTHVDVLNQLRADFPSESFPEFGDFEDAADPLQYLYNETVGKLLADLSASYNISIMEFHARDQGSRSVTGFIKNDAAGNAQLLAALNAISISDRGASEIMPAIANASGNLVLENSPIPSTESVIPASSFDDADVRTIILVTDGRITTGPDTVNDTVLLLLANRTRLYSVAWGSEVNAGPLAVVSSATGGHIYITKDLPDGSPLDPDTERVPSIETLYDWMSDDAGLGDACDQSIALDMRSQVVLSYVTLSVEDNIRGGVSATFDDPGDGNTVDFCRLPDQGSISGSFEQLLPVGDVVGFDTFGFGVNLGQVKMVHVAGAGMGAEVTLFVDYMPRDIRQLEFVVAVSDTLLDIDDVVMEVRTEIRSGGGLFEAVWSLDQLANGIDPGTGLNTQRYVINTSGLMDDLSGTPAIYGSFGKLITINLDVPGTTPYDFRLLSVTATAGNGSTTDKPFVHPDGIPVGTTRLLFPDGPMQPGITLDNTNFTAPSFPTPEVGPTLIDFGSTPDAGTGRNVSTRNFSIENIGGSFDADFIFLSWEIESGSVGVEDIIVTPDAGIRISTSEAIPQVVSVELSRDRNTVGSIQGLTLSLAYSTGIGGVGGTLPILLTGQILPPVLSVFSTEFLPDTFTFEFGDTDTLRELMIANNGQSRMLWFSSATPSWLEVSAPSSVTFDEPDTVAFVVFRDELIDPLNGFGASESIVVTITATTFDGALVGTQDILVTVDQ
jgi:hypothetical protein